MAPNRVSAISGCGCGEAPDRSLGYPLWVDGQELVGPVSIVHAPTPMGAEETPPEPPSHLGRSLALYVGVPLLTMVGASMAFDISLSAKGNTLPGLKLGVAAIVGVGAAWFIDKHVRVS